MPLIFSDDALNAATTAMTGLSRRQEAIGNNIANVDTPGYKAQTVDFESAIKQALNKSEALPLRTTNAAHLDAASQTDSIQMMNRAGGTMRADQNNVDIDTELSDMTATGLRYETLTQITSKRLQLFKDLLAYR